MQNNNNNQQEPQRPPALNLAALANIPPPPPNRIAYNPINFLDYEPGVPALAYPALPPNMQINDRIIFYLNFLRMSYNSIDRLEFSRCINDQLINLLEWANTQNHIKALVVQFLENNSTFESLLQNNIPGFILDIIRNCYLNMRNNNQQQNQVGGYYQQKYIKYKNKYLELKKSF
jgi:hypothetical protein